MTYFEKINTDAASKVGKLLKRLNYGCKYRIIRYEIGDLAFEIYYKFAKPYKDPRKSDPAHCSDLVRDLYALGDLLENWERGQEKDTTHALYGAHALPIMRVLVREYERETLAKG